MPFELSMKAWDDGLNDTPPERAALEFCLNLTSRQLNSQTRI